MKKFVFALAALAIVSCKKEQKEAQKDNEPATKVVAHPDYVNISGKIENKHSDSLAIINLKDRSRKIITINNDGTFADSLVAKQGSYVFYDFNNGAKLQLKNGDDIIINVDAQKFSETISFDGANKEVNKYFLESDAEIEKAYDNLASTDSVTYNSRLAEIKANVIKKLDALTDIDADFKTAQINEIDEGLKGAKEYYLHVQDLNKMKGQDSPAFEYENIKGGKTSLADLKGKYVYIDIWATWCGPCKKEIPHMKEVEKEYHGKNIEFVSISVDREKDYQKWKDMVAEKEMVGVQLIADKDWSSDFVKAYKVQGIPRFILIDPNGKIVEASAPRPSEPELKELLNGLNI